LSDWAVASIYRPVPVSKRAVSCPGKFSKLEASTKMLLQPQVLKIVKKS
jgi:hypothetical protein